MECLNCNNHQMLLGNENPDHCALYNKPIDINSDEECDGFKKVPFTDSDKEFNSIYNIGDKNEKFR